MPPGREPALEWSAVSSARQVINQVTSDRQASPTDPNEYLNYNGDLAEQSRDTLEQTYQNFEANPVGKPEPLFCETIDDLEFACFSNLEDLQDYSWCECKEDTQNLLENAEKTEEKLKEKDKKQADEAKDKTDSPPKTSPSSTLYTVTRQKRKITGAAVPYKDQYTYSFDFLDDENFGKKYVDPDNFEDEFYFLENFKTHSQGGGVHSRQVSGDALKKSKRVFDHGKARETPKHGKLQKKPQKLNNSEPKLSTDNFTVINPQKPKAFKRSVSISNKRKNQQQPKHIDIKVNVKKLDNCSLEETDLPLKEFPSDDDCKILLQEKMKQAFQALSSNLSEDVQSPLPAKRQKVEPLPASPLIDVELHQGMIPTIFHAAKFFPNFESVYDMWCKTQRKTYTDWQKSSQTYAKRREATRTTSLLARPDLRVLSALKAAVIPNEGIRGIGQQERQPAPQKQSQPPKQQMQNRQQQQKLPRQQQRQPQKQQLTRLPSSLSRQQYQRQQTQLHQQMLKRQYVANYQAPTGGQLLQQKRPPPPPPQVEHHQVLAAGKRPSFLGPNGGHTAGVASQQRQPKHVIIYRPGGAQTLQKAAAIGPSLQPPVQQQKPAEKVMSVGSGTIRLPATAVASSASNPVTSISGSVGTSGPATLNVLTPSKALTTATTPATTAAPKTLPAKEMPSSAALGAVKYPSAAQTVPSVTVNGGSKALPIKVMSTPSGQSVHLINGRQPVRLVALPPSTAGPSNGGQTQLTKKFVVVSLTKTVSESGSGDAVWQSAMTTVTPTIKYPLTFFTSKPTVINLETETKKAQQADAAMAKRLAKMFGPVTESASEFAIVPQKIQIC